MKTPFPILTHEDALVASDWYEEQGRLREAAELRQYRPLATPRIPLQRLSYSHSRYSPKCTSDNKYSMTMTGRLHYYFTDVGRNLLYFTAETRRGYEVLRFGQTRTGLPERWIVRSAPPPPI